MRKVVVYKVMKTLEVDERLESVEVHTVNVNNTSCCCCCCYCRLLFLLSMLMMTTVLHPRHQLINLSHNFHLHAVYKLFTTRC